MTFRIICSIALCLCTTLIYAQETSMNVLINYTRTNFNYGDLEESLDEYKQGVGSWQVGLTFQGGISKHFSLVPELYFMMKGGKLSDNNPLTSQTTTTRLYALDLPVLARIHLGNFYANAGPFASYNIAGKVKVDGTEHVEATKQKLSFDDSDDSYNRWASGMQFGLGYQIPLKKFKVVVDARYHYGLTNLVNTGERYNRYFFFNILISRAWKKNPLARAHK